MRKRFVSEAILTVLFGASAPLLVGCGEESKEKVKTEVSTPTGTTTTTSETKVEQSGSNPPPAEVPK